MLFTELKKIQDDDIEQALEERLKARGLDPAILHQSLGGSDVTVEELISDVVDGLIAQAVDANRESFRARQRKGYVQAQAAGKAGGPPALEPATRIARGNDRITRNVVMPFHIFAAVFFLSLIFIA